MVLKPFFYTYILCAAVVVSCTTAPEVSSPAPVESSQLKTYPDILSDDKVTVLSLNQEIIEIQKDLVKYIEPLSPEQALEVQNLKKALHQRETKKAQLELSQMILELKED